jgi:hypothetical protein
LRPKPNLGRFSFIPFKNAFSPAYRVREKKSRALDST